MRYEVGSKAVNTRHMQEFYTELHTRYNLELAVWNKTQRAVMGELPGVNYQGEGNQTISRDK